MPYVMAYDTRPLLTLQEKENVLNRAVAENWSLFFEHDPQIECVQIERTEKGIRKKESFQLAEFFN